MTPTITARARALLAAWRAEMHRSYVVHGVTPVTYGDADVARDIAELDEVIAGLAAPQAVLALSQDTERLGVVLKLAARAAVAMHRVLQGSPMHLLETNRDALLEAVGGKLKCVGGKWEVHVEILAATREPEGKMDQAVATCASGVAEGWKLVPIDPTKLMLVKGENALHRASHGDFVATEGELEAFWRAMLAAAPVASERDSMVPSPSAQPAEPKERKPLTDAQIEALIDATHFDPSYKRHASDETCLRWYRLGLRDGERAHGIQEQPKESKE